MASRRRWALDTARVLALALAVALHALLAAGVHEAWASAEIERRDYAVFVDAGRRLIGGQLEGVYDPRPGGFPFLHPPYVITLSAPLAPLGHRGAFVLLTLLALGALAASILALRRLSPRPGEHDVIWLAVLASAPWAITLVLGQPIALLLAAYLVALACLRSDRPGRGPLVSGLAFSVLLLKPTFAIAPLALALLRRDRRLLAGLAIGALALVLAALPAGLHRWAEWSEAVLRAAGEVGAARVPLWKQHTWLAFLRSVLPAWAAWAGWAALLPLGGLALARARRASPLRAGALLVLATLALSPYAYFYDALLFAVPGAAAWLERERYGARARAAVAGVAALTFAWQHAGFFVLQGRAPALGGLLATAWLLIEATRGCTPARAE